MKSFTRRELALGGLFAVALAWGAWNYRHVFDSAPEQPARAEAPVSSSAALNVPVPTVAQETNNLSASPEWGPDPFNRSWRATRKAVVAATRPLALRLSAIVVRPTQRYAIINGVIVREGDQVAGRRVTRIENARVLLDDQGVEVSLTL